MHRLVLRRSRNTWPARVVQQSPIERRATSQGGRSTLRASGLARRWRCCRGG